MNDENGNEKTIKKQQFSTNTKMDFGRVGLLIIRFINHGTTCFY